MFKYISEIISKISMKQRLAALAIVLFAIVSISIAPKIVNSFTQDNEELELKVETQRQMIIKLNTKVTELNDQILENQSVCTDRFVSREREILDMLTQMESEVKKTDGKIVSSTTTMERRQRVPTSVEEEDENGERVAKMVMPSPPVEKTVVVKNDNSKLLKMITKVKDNVKDHIQE